MSEQEPEQPSPEESLDQIARDLQQLRLEAGGISYADIVRRIAKHREANGVPPAAARPARTTIYDAFRTGRSRVNAQLIAEIVRALSGDDEEAARWERRCLTVRNTGPQPVQTPPSTLITPISPEPPAEPDHLHRSRWSATHPLAFRAVAMLGCLAINFGGYAGVEFLSIPLFLDSIGTGISAILLGPWWGVAVGVSTNALGYTIHGSMALPFALQSVAFALIWGYGVRKLNMARTIGSYFTLSTFVGLSHLLISAPLILILFDGGTGHAGDVVTHHLTDLGVPLAVSVYGCQIVISLADALVVSFIIMVAISRLKGNPLFQSHCEDLFPFLTHGVSTSHGPNAASRCPV